VLKLRRIPIRKFQKAFYQVAAAKGETKPTKNLPPVAISWPRHSSRHKR